MPSNNKLFPQSEREREREHGQKRDFEISKAKYF